MTDKPADPNATIHIDAADAQEVDLGEAEVVSADPPIARRTAPPPLPPQASLPPPTASLPPPTASQMPPPGMSVAPAPPPRSPLVYVAAIVVVLGVGLGIGALVTRATRKPAEPAAAPSSSSSPNAKPSVITIPIQEIDDSDAGP
jgi:hypothetical protein